MEFDIINDILYSSVSNLFPNKTLHLNFFIKEEDPYKADIPRSSSRKEDLRENSATKDTKDFNNPIFYENWKNKEAKKRLEEAIKRLNLDEGRIKSKNLSNFPSEYLISEKAKVKNELKKYDNEFTDLFNRTPNRAEKEVMRPIYLYYKNLKSVLDLKAKNQGNNSATTNSNVIAAASSNVNLGINIANNNQIINNNFIGNPISANILNQNKIQSNLLSIYLNFYFLKIIY